MLSHWLGMIGELLNLLGALTMALDIFLRGRERQREERLNLISETAQKAGIKRTIYKGYDVSSERFALSVLDAKTTMIAYIGCALFVGGFLMLIAHHGLELREKMNQSAVKCVVQ